MQRKRLHVLILPKWYPHSGDPQNGSFIAHFASEMSKVHQVSVLFPVPFDEEAPPEILSSGDLVEIRVPYLQSGLNWTLLRKMINYFRYRTAIQKGAARLTAQRETPDLIHAQVLIRPALFAESLSQKWKIPWLLTEHSSEFLRPGILSWIKTNIISRVCRKASHVVAVSQSLATGLETVSGLRNITVLPNIIDFGSFESEKSNPGKIRMAIVADLVDEVKNISGVLEALAKVRNRLPSCSLQIVGEGKDGDALKALTHRLGLDDVVTFLGRKNHREVMRFLPGIDFLITNSRSETFSIVTAEAISCGKPVIVTRCGGPEEWFREDYGIMISPDSAHELEMALIEMCDQYRSYPADHLARSIRNQFDSNEVISAYNQLYRQMIAS